MIIPPQAVPRAALGRRIAAGDEQQTVALLRARFSPLCPFCPVFSRPNGCPPSAAPLPDRGGPGWGTDAGGIAAALALAAMPPGGRAPRDMQLACNPNLRATLRPQFLDFHGRRLGNHAHTSCCLSAGIVRFVGIRRGKRIAGAAPASISPENVAQDAPATRKPRPLGRHRFVLRRSEADRAAICAAAGWTGQRFRSLEGGQGGNLRRAEGAISPLAGAKRAPTLKLAKRASGP